MRAKKRSLYRMGSAVVLAATIAICLPAEAHKRSNRPRHHAGRERARIVVGKPKIVEIVRIGDRPAGTLDLAVRPKSTQVWVDGTFRGSVDDFDGRPAKLHLVAGEHRVKLVTPDGVTVARDLRIVPGTEIEVSLQLP